jgi:hypothetical protein
MVGLARTSALAFRGPPGRGPGGDLGAAGVADEDYLLEAARFEPLRDGVGELQDVERVRRLATAGEAKQLDQVRAGPGGEPAHAGWR